MFATIKAIEYHVPADIVTTDQVFASDPERGYRIVKHTGIRERRIAGRDECSSDLAVCAAQKLFATGACNPNEVDYLLLCTQTPDYMLPSTSCLVQHRLKLSSSVGALDVNLGCSGFVYGLSLAKGLICSGQASNVLLITSETYSKLLHPDDCSSRAVFGDGAAATLVRATAESENGGCVRNFWFGTDGSGAGNLIVEGGGARYRSLAPILSMNGPEMFRASIQLVPRLVHRMLESEGKTVADLDLVVFHQANASMLEHLRGKLAIPPDKFCVYLDDVGNTVSSTIPIALKKAWNEGRLKKGMQVLVAGWGVGYSWAGSFLQWC